MKPVIQCFNKCPNCGVVPFKNWSSGFGLTQKQLDKYLRRRSVCHKCGGEAMPLTLEQKRRLGLDGCEGYEAPPECLLDMMKGKGKIKP